MTQPESESASRPSGKTVGATTLAPDPHPPVAAGRPRRPGRPGSSLAARLGVQAVLWVYAVMAFGPIVSVLIGSLRPNRDILREPLGLPTSLYVGNYTRAWTTASMSTYFANSLLVTVGAVVLCLAVSSLLAYPLARWHFSGRAVVAALVLSGLMLPIRLGALPIFYMFQSMHLMDSRIGLILIYAAEGVPFSVFVLMAFMRSLPREVEEAAKIDGAGESRIFLQIIMPLVRPALAAVAVFRFAPTWNDFFFPLVLLRTSGKFTIPVGMTRFFGEHSTDRGALYAGVMLALIPAILIFVFAMKHIVAGLTAGVSK